MVSLLGVISRKIHYSSGVVFSPSLHLPPSTRATTEGKREITTNEHPGKQRRKERGHSFSTQYDCSSSKMSNTTSGGGGGDKDKVKGSPFITTSDVLNRLNAALSEQMGDHPTDGEDGGEHSIPVGAAGRQARFELQKRLPDGSAIPASPADLSTADFENKLSQAASFVQDLTVDQKLQWAEGQRNYGNQLYEAQQYEQAIDVYLTCLTVTADKEINDPALHLLFAKVMNNLALTTMQLQWYAKTVQFCSIALQELAERCDGGGSDNDKHSDEMCSQRSKLYFKRAKASRLRGDYALAVDDLDHATRWLERMDDDPMVAAPLRNAVYKEHQLLARAQTEAKRNETKQKRAMQQLLTSPRKLGTGRCIVPRLHLHSTKTRGCDADGGNENIRRCAHLCKPAAIQIKILPTCKSTLQGLGMEHSNCSTGWTSAKGSDSTLSKIDRVRQYFSIHSIDYS